MPGVRGPWRTALPVTYAGGVSGEEGYVLYIRFRVLGLMGFGVYLLEVSREEGNILIVNASARPPRLAGLPTVGTCNYRYTGI